MIEIPKQLQHPEFRFILVEEKGKGAIETGWTTTANYMFCEPRLHQLFDRGLNYGVCCGYGNLCFLEFDDPKLQKEVAQKLPPTYATQSGGGGIHFGFIIPNAKNITILDEEGHERASLRAKGRMVVAPGSTHPNGKKYKVHANLPIATLEFSKLQQILAPYKPITKTTNKARNTQDTKKAPVIEKIKQRISISDLLNELGVPTNKNPTECPLHPSVKGECLGFNDSEGWWNCFHCQQGGDIFHLYQLKNDCDFKTALKALAKIAGVEITVQKRLVGADLYDVEMKNKRLGI